MGLVHRTRYGYIEKWNRHPEYEHGPYNTVNHAEEGQTQQLHRSGNGRHQRVLDGALRVLPDDYQTQVVPQRVCSSGLVLLMWVFGLGGWLSLMYFWWTAISTPGHVTFVRWNEFHEFWIEGVLIHGTVIGWIVILVRHIRGLSKK